MKKSKNQKKKGKKKIFLILLLLLVVAGGIYFHLSNKKPVPVIKKLGVKTNYGKLYYKYLKQVKDNKEFDEYGLDDIESAKLRFIEAQDVSNPIMIISYKKNNKDNANLYYIDGKEVEFIKYESSAVKYIFTIATSSYDFFIKSVIGDTTSIIPIRDQIDYHKNLSNDNNNFASQINAIKFTSQDKESIADEDGKEVVITDYEETFIELDDSKEVSYNTNYNDKQLKECINNAVKNYKTNLELQNGDSRKRIKEEKDRVDILRRKIERLKKDKTKPKTNNTNQKQATKENTNKQNKTDNNGTNSIKANSNDIQLTKENADNIIKNFYGLDDNLSIEKEGLKQRFVSLGLVTYEGDNQKYYYYSSYNTFNDHNSYNGSVMVNALTGKIKDIVLVSREVPKDKIVPYNVEDKNVN